jgi:hypothetical protein
MAAGNIHHCRRCGHDISEKPMDIIEINRVLLRAAGF